MGFAILFITFFSEFLLSFGLYKYFKSAGEKSFWAFIPFVNTIVMQRIMGKPFYHVFLQFIPVLNIYYYAKDIRDFLYCFGIDSKKDRILALTFGPFYFPIKARNSYPVYKGVLSSLPVRTETRFRVISEIAISYGIVLVIASVIRLFTIETFSIPTPSNEGTLRVGDIVIASKYDYGARLPSTPLQIPLTHQRIWGTNIPSYLDWIELPYMRLPGFSSIKRQDFVVFNWPLDEGYPNDMKTNYIKRCVAIAGDTLEIKDTQLYVNGAMVENAPKIQFQYYVITSEEISSRFFARYDIRDYYRIPEGYVIHMMPSTAEELKKESVIENVLMNKQRQGEGDPQLFPNNSTLDWNIDFYGPLWIPKKGIKIQLNAENSTMYASTIVNYEGLEDVKIDNGLLYIDGKMARTYVFKQNYYFMMGDSRHNSLDSRFWGFVPEDHIVGKGIHVFHSKGSEKASVLDATQNDGSEPL